jgi:predicted nucleic acid-binding protein
MIVADTSVLLKLVLPEIRSEIAVGLRGEGLAAPSIWLAEAGNALWRKVQIGEISSNEGLALIRALTGGGIATLPMDDRVEDALRLAVQLKHPIYDCFFLDAAIRHDTVVVTDDARFAQAVRKHKKWSSHLRMLSDA